LMLCYFWGAYDDVVTVRLSLPTQLLRVLAFVHVVPHLFASARRWALVAGISVFFLFGWTLPTLAQRAHALENYAAETSNWIRDYIRDTRPKRSLVIEPQLTMLWIAYHVPSIHFSTLAERADEFLYHYHQGTFE